MRRDRENTSEFIAKKREMFLVSPSALERALHRSNPSPTGANVAGYEARGDQEAGGAGAAGAKCLCVCECVCVCV